MKNRIRFMFAWHKIVLNFKSFISSILVMTISLILIAFSLFFYHGTQYVENQYDHTLTKGMSRSGIFGFTSHPYRDYDIMNELYNSKEIESIGSTTLGGNDFECFSELRAIQSGNASDYVNSISGFLEILWINKTLLGFSELKLDTGNMITDQEINDGVMYMYLGSAYKDKVELGTIYEESNSKFQVQGFLERGSTWIDPDTINGIYATDANNVLDLEYSVIVADDFIHVGGLFFSISDGTTRDEAVKAITDIADKHEREITVGFLDDMYKSENEDTRLLISYIVRIMAVVVFSSLVMISCLQIVAILNDRRTYGILYSIGANEKDIGAIIIYENIIRAIFSFLLCSIGILPIVHNWYGGDILWSPFKEIVLQKVLPVVFISLIPIAIISCLAPLIFLHRTTPSQLIGGKND